jgi:hypothetical protein
MGRKPDNPTRSEMLKGSRHPFETEELANRYCRLMKLTSSNTTNWRVEPNNNGGFDAVGDWTPKVLERMK